MSDTARELETWLRKKAADLGKNAASRRSYAQASVDVMEETRKAGHKIAEQMMGRKIPKTSRADDLKSAAINERIAAKLEAEAAMLNRFADYAAQKAGE